jgi:predicted N-formylglutamate amidohydrolase
VSAAQARLIAEDEPPPVAFDAGDGRSPFVIVCDHAGRLLPRRLGSLGLPDGELRRHIAWDIGAGAVASRLGTLLGAVVIRQNYSRLAIDCNRPPAAASSIAELSERTAIPGNHGLDAAARRARRDEIFLPYHHRIAAELDRREAGGRPTVLVAMHSFTPVYLDVARSLHAGILYNRDRRIAGALLDLLRAEAGLAVGDNEPYALSDESDYTIPVHGEQRALPHVEIEVRQDLIADDAGEAVWAARLARLLPEAVRRLPAK